MSETLREISIRYATKQPHQIDNLLEGAPLLSTIPYVESTHGLQHVMERITRIDAAAFVQRDEPLPEADVTTELGHMDLGIMGFKIKAGEDKVASLCGKGNFPKYLARRTPKIIQKTGMNTDATVARLIKNYALANGNVINAGGTGDSTHTIIAVRWVEDETCGVYDKNGFPSGALFETTMLSNGKPYEDPKTQAIVYGASFKNYTGFMFENPKTCAAIVNIDDSHKPTKEMLKKLLRMIRAEDVGASYIIANPATADDYIDPLLATYPTGGESLINRVSDFNGVKVIRDYNLPETEAASDTSVKPEKEMFGKEGEYNKEFLLKQALSDATAKESTARDFGKGGQNASIAIRAIADTEVKDATGAKIEVLHSDKEDGEYSTLYSAELPATAKKKELLMEFILPSTFKGWAKVSVTGVTGATGTVTIAPKYIPR